MTVVRVVAAAIYRDGRLLLTRRAGPGPLAGLWELPGGKVEPGESDRTALCREIREELGVDLEVERWLAVTSVVIEGRRIEMQVYRASTEGIPQLSVHDALEWVDATTIEPRKWAPADVGLTEVLMAELSPADRRLPNEG